MCVDVWSCADGAYGWFYGDFFIPGEGPSLSYVGIYRFLNNPDIVLGQLYTCACLLWLHVSVCTLSRGVLCLCRPRVPQTALPSFATASRWCSLVFSPTSAPCCWCLKLKNRTCAACPCAAGWHVCDFVFHVFAAVVFCLSYGTSAVRKDIPVESEAAGRLKRELQLLVRRFKRAAGPARRNLQRMQARFLHRHDE